MAVYSINDTYYQPPDIDDNKFIDYILSRSLTPNPQEDEGNFFGRMGMIGMTEGESFVNTAPIQRATKLTGARGKKFRFYLGSFMEGPPRIGNNEKPKEGGQTLGRSYFDLETIQIYAPNLEIPNNDQNRQLAIPVLSGYMPALRQWWSNFFEETVMIFGLASMRGQSENYEVYTTITSSGVVDLQTTLSGMTESFKQMSEVNEVYAPTMHFAAWDTTYNPATQSNPNTATSSDKLTLTDINTTMTWLQERNRKKDGFNIRPGRIRMPASYNVGSEKSGYQNTSREDWIWLIPPTVKRDMIETTGSNTFAEYQTNLVQAVGRGTVTDNHLLGRIYGATFLEYRKVPRAYGGSAGDVPIARTLLLGGQSCVYACSGFSVPESYLARLNKRNMRYSQGNLDIRMWQWPISQGEGSVLRTESNIGITPLFWRDPKGGDTRKDRGRIAWDVACSSIDGSTF